MFSAVEAVLSSWVRQFKTRANLPVVLRWGDSSRLQLRLGDFERAKVEIIVKHASAVPLLMSPSLETLGEAYVEGKIDVTGNVEDVLEVARRMAAAGAQGEAARARAVRRSKHSKERDIEAVRYHYDLSNEFYQVWLDPAMVYSCAYFENGDESLELAQQKKLDHILTKVQLKPGQRLLDIGCGWGALVLRAAEKFGARCVGVTLSKNQHELASRRVREAGLQDRVEVRLQDYRDVTGEFDRITSVGMFEHVGLKHLSAYFGKIRELLAPDGWALNHGITSSDANDEETALGGGRFIDRYVFPQGELPHISTVLKHMQLGGLEAIDVESLRRHYARTMLHWSQAFERNAEKLRSLVDEKRWRIWRIYLAGCQLAFENDDISVYQVLCRPSGRSSQQQPWSRRWMYA